jgi:hypothetical protein
LEYNAEADQRSWKAMKKFLKRNFSLRASTGSASDNTMNDKAAKNMPY